MKIEQLRKAARKGIVPERKRDLFSPTSDPMDDARWIGCVSCDKTATHEQKDAVGPSMAYCDDHEECCDDCRGRRAFGSNRLCLTCDRIIPMKIFSGSASDED